jgi:hypothetical protein
MKQSHLYKIKETYLYVLQTVNDKNSMDILAIRGDIPYIIFPMYSSTFKKYEDLGIPSVDTLKSIDPYFLTCIQVSQILCGDLFVLSSNNLREYIREYILDMNISSRQTQGNIDLLTMSINRSRALNMEELRKYVANRIHNSSTNAICKEN